MLLYFEVENLSDHLLNTLQSRIAKLEEFITIHADEMVVLPVTVRALVLGLIFTELVPYDQIAFQQQIERIIYSGATHPGLILPHSQEQLVRIEVIVVGIGLLQYSKSFRGLPLVALLQEPAEGSAHLFHLVR